MVWLIYFTWPTPHAAHSLLHDLVRDSEQFVQGPPGPPGPPGTPGHVRWVSSGENVVDVVEYIRCRLILSCRLYVVVHANLTSKLSQ